MRRERQFWILWILSVAILGLGFAFSRAIFMNHAVRGPFVAVARVTRLPIGKVDGYTLRYADVALYARVLESEGLDQPFNRAVESAGDTLRLRRLFDDAGITFAGTPDPNEADRVVMDRYDLTTREWRTVFGERTARIAELSQEMKRNPVLQASARKETESLVELLSSGVAFSDLAREFSIHSSSVLGGSLGEETWFTLDDEFTPLGVDTLKNALESGETSILDSEQGFIIIQAEPIDEEFFEVSIIMTPKDDLQTIVDRYRSRYPLKRFY